MIIQQMIESASAQLKNSGHDTARLDADLLAAHILNCSREDLYLRGNEEVSESTYRQFSQMVQRRLSGEPVAYLVGYKEFYGLKFQVNSNVLIPRPETELIVEQVLRIFEPDDAFVCMDMGTGSGCLAVAIAKTFENSQVIAVDASKNALNLAMANAQLNEVEHRVQFILGDLNMAKVELKIPKASVDIVVSNPPYIGDNQWVEPNVKKYEPAMALFSGDELGLSCYNQWITNSRQWLKPSGILIVELGHKQKVAVQEILKQNAFDEIFCHHDLAGLDRVMQATYRGK